MEFGYGPTFYSSELDYEEEQQLKKSWKQLYTGVTPDRTIQLAPIEDQRGLDYQNGFQTNEYVQCAYKNFKQFGVVESINIHYGWTENQYTLYKLFVQFKDVEVAGLFLKRGHCRFRGVKYEVKPLQKPSNGDNISIQLENLTFQEEEDPLSICPTEDSPNNILNALDDDCLCLVFEQIDQLADFVTITKVCTRFKRLVKRISRSIIKQFTLNFADLTLEKEVKLSEIEEFLCEFGSFILNVSLNKICINHIVDAPNILLKMINKYCKNIRKLYLRDIIEITSQTVFEIQPLLSKLKHLDIALSGGPEFIEFTLFISVCTKLEYLYLYIEEFVWFEFQYILPTITFPNLIGFHLIYRTTGDSLMSYYEFLERNPQIEILTIFYTENLCHFVAHDMPNIREINIFSLDENLPGQNIIALRKLKHLKVKLSWYDSLDSIRRILPVKNINRLCLTITSTNLTDQDLLIELTKDLHKLTNLQIFFDEQMVSMNLLKQMLQHAHQLSDFYVVCPMNDPLLLQ